MPISRTIAWTVWMLGSLFYAYQYIFRVMPNIMIDDIMQQFHMDAAVFGQFSGAYYIGYSLIHLPMGVVLDRYGPKRVIPCCILLTVIGLLPLIFAENWIYPIFGRALTGIGSSAAILGTFKIIRMTFNEKQFTRMLSFSVSIGLLGAIYGGEPLNYMCNALGYKVVIQILAGVGVILAVMTYLIVPKGESKNQKTRQSTVISDIKTVFTNRKVMAVCFFASLMVGCLEGFPDVWASDFLKLAYGFGEGVSSTLPSMIFVGMCFGAPILSLIAEKTGQYIGSIIGAGVIMLMIFIALLAGLLTINSMTVGFILIGVCCAYQILAIYKASTYVPENLVGLTTATANMIIMSFGYVFHACIGFVIDTFGGIHNVSAFVYGMSVIPTALGMGIMGFIILAYVEKKGVIFEKKGRKI